MCSALMASIIWACPRHPSLGGQSETSIQAYPLVPSSKSLMCELGSDPCMCRSGWVQKILSNFTGSLSQTASSLWSPHYFSITGGSPFWPSSQKPNYFHDCIISRAKWWGAEKEGRKVRGPPNYNFREQRILPLPQKFASCGFLLLPLLLLLPP